MVARSFEYSSPTPAKAAERKERGSLTVGNHPESKSAGRTKRAKSLGRPSKMFTPAPPTPSSPVVIPTRSRNDVRRKSGESVSRDKKQDTKTPHDPSLTPPSMAALLAMTDLPEPKKYSHSDTRRKEPFVTSRKISNAKLRETPKPALSSSSPRSWDLLLSPPEDLGLETSSLESDPALGPSSSFRSLSAESMPSLDTDTESLSSTSNPATPDLMMGIRMSNDRRQKSISTSVGEDCALDHPLLFPTLRKTLEEDSANEPQDLPVPTALPPPKAGYSIKSNLTASFRKIRSAAQSFSAFTAPPTQREDHLARTLLSMDSQFPDERRPQPLGDVPDPALRRYLNPITFSPAELHFHFGESNPSSCTASIQLQTYQRRNRNSDKASSPPVFTSTQQKALDAVDGLPEVSSPRQREPRENSDFLRVIVLEMSMRKRGKLSDASPGRARLWLPARQAGRCSGESVDEETRIPARWVGMQA